MAHGHNAHLNIQLWLNRRLSLSVTMTNNQNQLFGQNSHCWNRTTPELFCKTFVQPSEVTIKVMEGIFFLFPLYVNGNFTLP